MPIRKRMKTDFCLLPLANVICRVQPVQVERVRRIHVTQDYDP